MLETADKTLKILICDDDIQDRKLIRYYLQDIADWHIDTIEAGRQDEIQAAIDNGKVDVVLLDLQMPEKSGVDWLREIVAKDFAPVIILSGYGDEEVAANSIQNGAFGYIPKRRLSTEKLVGTIDRVLEKRRE